MEHLIGSKITKERPRRRRRGERSRRRSRVIDRSPRIRKIRSLSLPPRVKRRTIRSISRQSRLLMVADQCRGEKLKNHHQSPARLNSEMHQPETKRRRSLKELVRLHRHRPQPRLRSLLMNTLTMEEAQEKQRKPWSAPPRNDKVDYAGGQGFDVNLSDLYVLHYVNECQIDQNIMIKV